MIESATTALPPTTTASLSLAASLTAPKSLPFVSNIAMLFSAAGAATDNASANLPFNPLTTATLSAFNSLATFADVSNLSTPDILSTFNPAFSNSATTALETTPSPPTTNTFLAPNFSILSLVAFVNSVASVKRIGASFNFASGVAASASAIAKALTKTTLSAFSHFSLTFTAVSYLLFPANNFFSIVSFDSTANTFVATADVRVAPSNSVEITLELFFIFLLPFSF